MGLCLFILLLLMLYQLQAKNRQASVPCEEPGGKGCRDISSLHWPILVFFYALFVQWSILPLTNRLPLFFLPFLISLISSAQTTILYILTQSSFVSHTYNYKPCFFYKKPIPEYYIVH